MGNRISLVGLKELCYWILNHSAVINFAVSHVSCYPIVPGPIETAHLGRYLSVRRRLWIPELMMCGSTGSFSLLQPVFFVWLMFRLIIVIVGTLNIDVRSLLPDAFNIISLDSVTNYFR